MPNGHSSDPRYKELMRSYESYFAPIAVTLVEFADRHNLLVEKYYHDAPVWSLCFSHPAKGQAKIDICQHLPEEIEIVGMWWVDNFDAFTRNIKYSTRSISKRTPQIVDRLLEQVLATVLAWLPGKWSTTATGYEKSWGRFTKNQFEALLKQWPRPR